MARRPSFLLPLVLLVALLACSSEEDKFQEHLSRASEYEQDGKQLEAILELRSALKLRPRDAALNYQIAQELMALRRYLDSAFFFEEAYRLDPTNVDSALAAAKLILQDDIDRAEKLVAEANQRAPENPRVHLLRSDIALVRGNTQEALTSALTSTQLDPSNGHGFLQLGIVHMARIREARLRRRQPEEHLFKAAELAFERSDQLYGGSPEARLELGRLYFTWPSHSQEAVAALRRALEAAEVNADTLVMTADMVARLAASVGDNDLRRFALERIVEVQPESLPAWRELALLEEMRGGSAEGIYRRLVATRPDDVEARVVLARYLSSQGRPEDGLEYLKQTVQEGVSPVQALGATVEMLTSLNRLDEAQVTLERMQARAPGHPLTDLARARLATTLGRDAEAAQILRELTARDPGTDAQALLALSEYRLGNLSAAIAAINHSLEGTRGGLLAPMRVQLKAEILQQAQDWTGLLRTLRRHGENGYPLDPWQRVMMARALYGLGRDAAARAILEQVFVSESSPPVGAVIEFATHEGTRDPEKVQRLVDMALEKSPDNPFLLRSAAVLDLRSNRPESALERVDRALESRRRSAGTGRLLRAQVLTELNRLEEAEGEALKAFQAEPNAPGAIDLLVSLYQRQGKTGEAIGSLEEAERSGVLSAGPRVLLGRLYASHGQPDRAVEMYEKALAERSDLPGAKNDLAYLLAEKGTDLDRALRLAQEAQQAMSENPRIADTLGFVYLRKGLATGALEQFQHAIDLAQKTAEDHPAFHYHLGLALRAVGRHAKAVEAFEAALALDPSFEAAGDLRRELEAARVAAKAASESS